LNIVNTDIINVLENLELNLDVLSILIFDFVSSVCYPGIYLTSIPIEVFDSTAIIENIIFNGISYINITDDIEAVELVQLFDLFALLEIDSITIIDIAEIEALLEKIFIENINILEYNIVYPILGFFSSESIFLTENFYNYLNLLYFISSDAIVILENRVLTEVFWNLYAEIYDAVPRHRIFEIDKEEASL
jgi:hypothetical protein